MHETSALAHQLQPLLETQGIGRRQRRRLAQRKPRRRLKLQIPNQLLQQLKRHPAHQINPGLRIFGFRQFRFGSVETNARQIVAHRRVGAVEQCPGCRIFLRQIFPHPERLGPLPGK